MQSFDLLGLPAELRLIVYEQMSLTTRHIDFPYSPPNHPSLTSHTTLVVKTAPILEVCRQVQVEATSIMQPRLLAEPLRFIVDLSDIFLVFKFSTSQHVHFILEHIATDVERLKSNSYTASQKLASSTFSLLKETISRSTSPLKHRSLASFIDRSAHFILARCPASTFVLFRKPRDQNASKLGFLRFTLTHGWGDIDQWLPQPVTFALDRGNNEEQQATRFDWSDGWTTRNETLENHFKQLVEAHSNAVKSGVYDAQDWDES
jgi:hypothetical protein